MFAHSKLLRTFVFLFAGAAIVLGHAIPSPNAHDAAIQAEEHKNPPVVLESRASGRTLFSKTELGWIYRLCKDITRQYKKYDYWFFVGNSGGYLAYCFNNPRFKPIPISNARRYYMLPNPEDDPDGKGRLRNEADDLIKYYDEIIEPKITFVNDQTGDREFYRIDRIMLVDHSSTGASVEATRWLLMHMFQVKGEEVKNLFAQVKWGLFNVVDKGKLDGQDRPLAGEVTAPDPTYFQTPIIRTVGKKGDVNKLLGDKKAHYRCQVDYWPALWYLSVEQAWELKKGTKEKASSIRQQIRNAVKDKTRDKKLLDPTPTD